VEWLNNLRRDVAADREARWEGAGPAFDYSQLTPEMVVNASDVVVETRDVTPETVIRNGEIVSFPREVESRVLPGVTYRPDVLSNALNLLAPGFEGDPEGAMLDLEQRVGSWTEPFDQPSRLLGSAVSNVAGVLGVEGGEVESPFVEGRVEGPLLSESLRELGAPEWAAMASEFLVPDPVGAGKATDLVPLLGMSIPFLRSARRVKPGFDDYLKTLEADGSDFTLNEAITNLAGTRDNGTFDLGRGYAIKVNEDEVTVFGPTRNVDFQEQPYIAFRIEENVWPYEDVPSEDVMFVKALYSPVDNPSGMVLAGLLADISDATGTPIVGKPQPFGSFAVPVNELRAMYNKLGFQPTEVLEGVDINTGIDAVGQSVDVGLGTYVRLPIKADTPRGREWELHKRGYQPLGRTADVDALSMPARKAMWTLFDSLMHSDYPTGRFRRSEVGDVNALHSVASVIKNLQAETSDSYLAELLDLNALGGSMGHMVDVEDFDALIRELNSSNFDYLTSLPEENVVGRRFLEVMRESMSEVLD